MLDYAWICLNMTRFGINIPLPKRNTAISRKFLELGAKKVFIIALVPDFSENYINVERPWLNSGLDTLKKKCTVATDLKLCNNFSWNGVSHFLPPLLTEHYLKRNSLQKKVNNKPFLVLWHFSGTFSNHVKKRKLPRILEISSNFQKHNCNDTLVISVPPPAELHFLNGPVCKIYGQMECMGSKWAMTKGMQHKNRHLSWWDLQWEWQ